MSIDKSKLKMLMANDIGVSIEDRLDAAKNEIHQYDGAYQALLQAAKALDSLFKHVDKDVDEGKYSEVGEELKVAGVAKSYIKKAIGLLDNLATSSKVQGITARGKVQGLELAVGVVKKVYDTAAAKKEAFEQAVRDGKIQVEGGDNVTPLHRLGGDIRPEGSAADDIQARRAEARAKKEAVKKGGDTPSEKPQESPVVPIRKRQQKKGPTKGPIS